MKKILAFVLSASMCLSLLTALSPAFAYEKNNEQNAMMRMVGDPDEDESGREPLRGQVENN